MEHKTIDFINKSKEVHGNKYDYSRTNYLKAQEKIIIICKIHGEFEQKACSHLNGSGCKKCGMIQKAESRKSNIDEFIEKANLIHNNKYNYSESVYINTKTKISIICYTHGKFNQRPSDHLKGRGCSKCANEENANNCRSNVDEFIEKSNLIHGNKYDYSESIYVNSKTKISIICQVHGKFKQCPSEHFQGKGCKKCANEKNANNFRSNTSEFIEKSIKLHCDLYDYSKVNYVKAQEKVIIICKTHGEFEQKPCSHLNGQGCKKCGIEKNANSRRSNASKFIEKSINVHNNRYDYSKVNYVNSQKKVIIICENHGEFEQIPSHHVTGIGCTRCAIEINAKKATYNTSTFIEKSIEIHGDKYDYSKVNYVESKQKVIIICKIHGEFKQRAREHYNGSGCPKCSKQHSIGQVQWLNFMQTKEKIHIQHIGNFQEYQIPNSRFKADGYCEETNTIYEYHGDYWHGNPKKFNSNDINKTTKCTFGQLYQKTLEREQQIKDMGFNLVSIWENDWIKLNKCVKTLQRKFKSNLK